MQSRFPARRGQRRLHHELDEPADHFLYHPKLQALFRLEMCKQSALGELRLVCKYPYGKTFIANIADNAERMSDDRAPGLSPLRLAFSHPANRGTAMHFRSHDNSNGSTIVRFGKR